jgi:hypothetical protein
MTITQMVEIPVNRILTIEVPKEVPTGQALLTFTPKKIEQCQKRRRKLGCVVGDYWMADDFDAPLEDFKDYM